MHTRPRPFVSIVMPALNEEAYIEAAIQSVVPRAEDHLDYELLVVDGGSSDRTQSIVTELGRADPRVRLLVNPRRIQSSAVNIAAEQADERSGYLVRADCHAKYPQGFAKRCIDLIGDKQAASVVVSMHTRGENCLQKAVAAAQNSRLGNGGAAHRLQGRSGYVDHGHHAAIDRKVFLALGGYDETFTHNEDAEFDTRLIRSGGKIYLDGEASIDYFPRTSLTALARQYFNFGWGRANTILKHGARPRMRQLLPVVVFMLCVPALLLSPFDPLFVLPAALYASTCIAWGLALAVRRRERCLAASGIAAIVMHMGWAVGFLSRMARFVVRGGGREAAGKRGGARPSSLARLLPKQ
jgi:succinoglycan biosynthesis protein ExoA